MQGYYFKLLLFAFLSETEEKTLSDIIEHIETDADGKRIGRHLQIDVSDLRLFREKIHPAILSCLENKIHNIHQLGTEITPDNIGIALRKLSRLSVSEVVTPPAVARELVESLPPEITANSRILDIASKTGEFAGALLQKYGDAIKNNIYSIPTSGVTYECTRKIYRLLGLPAEHIYSGFTSYDIIDKTKNEKLLKELADMKFDAIVGNPPYQVMAAGDANGSDPIYHLFIDAARTFGQRVSFVHPARFLFNAGKTPKEWNEKMLNDDHYKVVKYWVNSFDAFPTVDIKGGVAVTYWDKNKTFGKIGTFVAFDELNSILKKVKEKDFKPFSDLVYPRTLYRFTDKLYKENPWAKDKPSKGHLYDMSSNVFDIFPELFFNEKPNDDEEYAGIYGLDNKKREYRWIKKSYVKVPDNFNSYKVLVPAANGSGAIGEVLSTPVIGQPVIGHTETFLSVGKFGIEEEANACLKYIKTKFARAMLGTLKITQHNIQETWLNVPPPRLHRKQRHRLEQTHRSHRPQLYKKYNLDATEIAFIEKNVREME